MLFKLIADDEFINDTCISSTFQGNFNVFNLKYTRSSQLFCCVMLDTKCPSNHWTLTIADYHMTEIYLELHLT